MGNKEGKRSYSLTPEMVIACLRQHGKQTPRQIADRLEVPTGAVYDHLSRLEKNGRVVRSGVNPFTRWSAS